MVLRPKNFMQVDRVIRRERGVTLIELLLAVALSSFVVAMVFAFFKDAGFAAHLIRGHRNTGFRSQALFGSLCENVLAGGGVIEVGERSLTLLNSQDQKMEYRWEDSSVFVNGQAVDIRVADMQVEATGPDRPNGDGWASERSAPWDLDSLDQDRDGHIDFHELDQNHSDDLDQQECRFVARYRLTLTVIDQGLPMTLTAVIHPRNHVPASAEFANFRK